jgi:hypothetical protein
MRIALLLFLTLTVTCIFSQDVERTRTGTTLGKLKRNVPFYFLDEKIDTTGLTFVGTFKASAKGGKSEIKNLYDAIQEAAKKVGANTFKLVRFHRAENDEGELILDTYSADEAVIAQSQQLQERNVVFIFFEERRAPDHDIAFKINEDRRVLHGGQYYAHSLQENEQVKISKGGLSNMWISGEKDRPAAFISLTGFATEKSSQQLRSAGTPYNENKIYTIDRNLGAMLTRVLQRVE